MVATMLGCQLPKVEVQSREAAEDITAFADFPVPHRKRSGPPTQSSGSTKRSTRRSSAAPTLRPDRGPRRVAGLRAPLPLRGLHGPRRRRTHPHPAPRDHPGGRHHRTHRVIVRPDPPRSRTRARHLHHAEGRHPETGSARTVSVSDELIEMLSGQAAYAWGDEGWLFGVGALLNRNSAGHNVATDATTGRAGGIRPSRPAPLLRLGPGADGCVVTVQHALGRSIPTITLDTYSHLWPKAEDRTRAAAASLWRSADSVRTQSPDQAGDLRAQR
jgi:hypothetical protein